MVFGWGMVGGHWALRIKQSLRIAQPLMVLLAFGFVAMLLVNQWEQLRNQPWRLHGGWLFLCTLFLVISWLLEVFIWQQLLRMLGGHLAYWTSIRAWFLSAIVRYIPGNIWQPLSLTVRCQEAGVRPEITLTSVLLYQVIILLAAAPIGAIYVWATENWGLLSHWFSRQLIERVGPWLIGAALLPVLLLLIKPSVFVDILNGALHMVRRPALIVRLNRWQVTMILLLAAFDWLMWGTSFAAITFALADYSIDEQVRLLPHLLASYSIAYSIGFLSFITPSGFGVREGAFYLLLTPILGGGPATITALAMRIWTTIGEVVMALLAALVNRRGQA